MIAKARAEFPFKVSTKQFAQNYGVQNSGWLFLLGSPPDYWTREFPVKAFCENLNMVAILMISAESATLDLLKMKVFRNKGYDVMISVHDFTSKVLSRDSNYIVDPVM